VRVIDGGSGLQHDTPCCRQGGRPASCNTVPRNSNKSLRSHSQHSPRIQISIEKKVETTVEGKKERTHQVSVLSPQKKSTNPGPSARHFKRSLWDRWVVHRSACPLSIAAPLRVLCDRSHVDCHSVFSRASQQCKCGA